ncbi:hypothetical protein I317_03785 [Kwoniella heveanensis CBS 569]|nr:hypothetical protein I317_03785 [Kwoniella heveanensis CBS 569]
MSLVYEWKRQQDPSIEDSGRQREAEIQAHLDQRRLHTVMSRIQGDSRRMMHALTENVQRGRFSLPSSLGLSEVTPSMRAGVPGHMGESLRRPESGSECRAALSNLILDNAHLLMLANGNERNLASPTEADIIEQGFVPLQSSAEQLRAYTDSLRKLQDSLEDYKELYSMGSPDERCAHHTSRSGVALDDAGTDTCSGTRTGLPPVPKASLVLAQDLVRRIERERLVSSVEAHDQANPPAETVSAAEICTRKLDISQVTSFLATRHALSESRTSIHEDLGSRTKYFEQLSKKRRKNAADVHAMKHVGPWRSAYYDSYQPTYQQVRTTLQGLDPAPTDEERRELRDVATRLRKHLNDHPQLAREVFLTHSFSLIHQGSSSGSSPGADVNGSIKIDGKYLVGSSLGDIATLASAFAVPDVLDQSVYDALHQELRAHRPLVGLIGDPSTSVVLLREIDRTEGIARALYDQWREDQIKRTDYDCSQCVDIPALVGLKGTDTNASASAAESEHGHDGHCIGLPDQREFMERMIRASHLMRDQRTEAWKTYVAASAMQAKCEGYSVAFDQFTETLRRSFVEHRTRLDELEGTFCTGSHNGGAESRTAIDAMRAKTEVDQLDAQQIVLQHQRAQGIESAISAGLSLEEYLPTQASQAEEQVELESALRKARVKLTQAKEVMDSTSFMSDSTVDDVDRRLCARASAASLVVGTNYAESTSNTSDSSTLLTPSSKRTDPASFPS